MSAAIHELAHALSAACISAGISSSVELLKHSAAEPQARSAPVPAAPAEDELPPAIPDTALPSDDQLPAIPDDQPPAIPDDQPPAIPDDLPPAIPDDLPPADLPPAIPSEPVPSDEPAAAQKAPDAVAPAQAFVREGSKKVPPPVAPKPRLSRGSSQEALPLPSTSNPSAQSAPLTAVSEAQEAKPAAVTPAAVESSGVVMRVKPDRDRARDLAVRSSLADSGLNSVAKDVDTKPKTIERFTIEMPQLRKVSGAVKTGARPPGSDLAVLKEPVVVEPVKRSETAVAALKASGTDVKPPSTPEWRRKLRATQQASATPSGSSAFPVVQRVRPVSIATDSVIGEAPRAPDWKRKLSKTTPVDAKPAEVKPVEVKPAEANPVEVKPVEAKPVEAKPSHPPPIERLAASDEGAQAGIDETAQAANAAEQTASKAETRKIGVMRRASSQESRSPATVILDQKALKFAKLLEAPMADLEAVRQLSWNGISIEFRPIFWMLLSGYVPVNKERRTVALTKKRAEYWDLLVNQHYLPQKDEAEQSTFRQIQMDIERTGAGYGMFRQEKTKELLCRILYIWAIRHGACGYVQGMNDLLLPYLIVFLHPHTPHADGGYQIEQMDIDTIESTALAQVEADCFWCFNNLLNGLQENFTFAQPGIQTKVLLLSELTAQTDRALHSHLQALRIEYLQFALRWMNCLLTRELPILCAIRLWDTYHAEVDGFAVFHVYVCAAFLNFFSRSVLEQADFQDALLLLQRTPTERWSNVEIELILAQAYQLKHARDTQK
eukprot:m.504561 g.504561  ORF g.504561 m.504561 type:complete len:778 (+) comp57355_c0_seq10:248-2581(+)